MNEHAEGIAAAPAIEMVDATLTSLTDSTRVVAEEVNWAVMPGDYWVIGGLHGVGKSDFVAAAAGILLPSRGTYRLFGKKIEHGFEQELVETRLRLGVVFDGGRLLNHLTIAENVALPMQYHLALAQDELLERVVGLLEAVDLSNLANAFPASISRNRQQRVGLARAMALRPEVLLLDAPLSGLDPTDSNWWIEIIDRLAEGHPAMGGRPATLVATAHDFRPWRGHARQFAALRQKHLRLFRHLGADSEEHLMRNGGQGPRLMALQDLTPQLRTRLSRLERVVGIFVVLATLLLLAGLGYYVYSTAERKGWFKQKLPYFTFVRSGTGLQVGDPIRLMGFTAGRIIEIEAMPPYQDQFGDVFVRFEILEPYHGYIWEDSVARVEPANFLGGRYIEVTKGTNSAPTYTFYAFEEMTLNELRGRSLTNLVFSQEIWSDAITNYVVRPFYVVTAERIDRVADLGVTTVQIGDKGKETANPAGIWDDKAGKYVKINDERKKGYWVHVDETPAVSERLQKIANQVEAALPNFLALTNTLVRALTNIDSVVRHTDELLVSAKPVVTNFAKISENLSGPQGTLGDWLIPTNVNAQLTMTIASANTNVNLLSSNLLATLDNVANLTSNLNAQVQANGLILSEISRLIVNADDMVQGLKRNWLLRGSFGAQTNGPAESVIKPRMGR